MAWEFVSKARHISQEEFKTVQLVKCPSRKRKQGTYFIFMARMKLGWKNSLESSIQNVSPVLQNRETSKPKPRALHKEMQTPVQPL